MGDLQGPGFFNKPRYRHEVLIGNWYEDRALRDPAFLVSTSGRKPAATVDNVVKDEVRLTSVTNKDVIVNGSKTFKTGLNGASTNYDQSYMVSPVDPVRGYYATTYKRSYGPHQGYIHLDSYPKADDFTSRRETAVNPERTTSLEQSDDGKKNGCLRCEQLAKSTKENSACLRCLQLAGL